jgi:hypothetical protein
MFIKFSPDGAEAPQDLKQAIEALHNQHIPFDTIYIPCKEADIESKYEHVHIKTMDCVCGPGTAILTMDAISEATHEFLHSLASHSHEDSMPH